MLLHLGLPDVLHQYTLIIAVVQHDTEKIVNDMWKNKIFRISASITENWAQIRWNTACKKRILGIAYYSIVKERKHSVLNM